MSRRRAAVALLCAALAAGCAAVTKGVTTAGVATKVMTQEQATHLQEESKSVDKAFEDFTPEQEHYIGRSVAATILGSYRVFADKEATQYVNTIGTALAMASEKPLTFKGYHFLILDSDEVNAFAAPGGLILVTRGILRCGRREDAVAAVLAHEIAHVVHGHGVSAIEKSRITTALTGFAAESTRTLGGERLAAVAAAFEGSISDVTNALVTSGYSQTSELQADQTSVGILERVGYDPAALRDMLQEMKARVKGKEGFGRTHPDPSIRISAVELRLKAAKTPVPAPAARGERFTRATARL